MLRNHRRLVLSLLVLLPVLIAPVGQAKTWTSCPGQKIAYYVFTDVPPTLTLLQEFFRGKVSPILSGPQEYRIVQELVGDPATSGAKGDLLYAVCDDQMSGFEAVTGVASKLKVGSELHLLRDFAGAVIGSRFYDIDQNAVGGGIAVQTFFECTVEVGGQNLVEHPVIHNAAVFHTGADLTAINASAAAIEQYWAAPLRQRLRQATQDWIESNSFCNAIDKDQFVTMMEDGARPLVHYQAIDPTVGVPFSIP